MKFKLPLQYFLVVYGIMNQLSLDNFIEENLIVKQWKATAFDELKQMFHSVLVKFQHEPLTKKVSSKKIADSYLILFFALYNGKQMPGYDNVVLKEFCKQIENELFKSGKYSLPLKY